MAKKEFYHDIDLVKVGQILNARVHNVTTAERTTLGGTLNTNHTGLAVFDTDEDFPYWWDGAQWISAAPTVAGAMVYKGAYSDTANEPANPEVGHVYLWTGADATLTWAGKTFSPDATIETNDQLIYRGSDTWDIYDGSEEQASETVAGIMALATQAEAIAGLVTDEAITPATLHAVINSLELSKTYFETATLTAFTPYTVNHGLNLQNKDAFVLRVADSTGSEIEVDVDSTDANNCTVTSFLGLTDVRIAVVGS